jgi:co-chaperonin GroES (HSP10)
MTLRFEAEGVPVEKLPIPVGWRVLIAPIKIEEMSAGGIALVNESIKSEEYFRNVGKVLAVGPAAYSHEKFMNAVLIDGDVKKIRCEPWCKVDDVIGYHSFNGVNRVLKIGDETHTIRYINDDEVIELITDVSVLGLN